MTEAWSAIERWTAMTPAERWAHIERIGPVYRHDRLGLEHINLAATYRKAIAALRED